MANELTSLMEASKELDGIHGLLETFIKKGGSDLHIVSDERPYITKNTQTTPIDEYPEPFSEKEVTQMLWAIVSSENWDTFKKERSLDASYYLKSANARFRLNYFFEKGKPSAVLRPIPVEIKSLSDWGLPESLKRLAYLPRGLVLITGAVGSGKSTTTAGIIKEINDNRHANVITIEAPIEFIHSNNKSLIRQREIGVDVTSFYQGLRDALRQAPDVIFIGELRDAETIKTAIKASEVGRLVIGTLHTGSVSETIDRVMLEFSFDEQKQIKAAFLSSLQGVVCQTMVRDIHGKSCVALEIMFVTPQMQEYFFKAQDFKNINKIIKQTGKIGNVLLDDSLIKLAKEKKITPKVAVASAKDTNYVSSHFISSPLERV
jgi:twitching motility protein PilT